MARTVIRIFPYRSQEIAFELTRAALDRVRDEARLMDRLRPDFEQRVVHTLDNPRAVAAWRSVLAGDKRQLRKRLLAPDDEAALLRSPAPNTYVLSSDERRSVLRAVRARRSRLGFGDPPAAPRPLPRPLQVRGHP